MRQYCPKQIPIYFNAYSYWHISCLFVLPSFIGVFLNLTAVHPLTGRPVPVLAADYVVDHYGTGVVMGVPAHDDRDSEFANNVKLPSLNVISEDGRLVDSEMVRVRKKILIQSILLFLSLIQVFLH